MEKVCSDTLITLSADLKGTYHTLSGMSKETQDQLTADHFLFNDHDR